MGVHVKRENGRWRIAGWKVFAAETDRPQTLEVKQSVDQRIHPPSPVTRVRRRRRSENLRTAFGSPRTPQPVIVTLAEFARHCVGVSRALSPQEILIAQDAALVGECVVVR